jgi:alpha-mannosidase
VTDPAVVVDAVKLAEDRSGDVVVRVYESLGRRVTATVQAGFGAADVSVTDLLERPLVGTARWAGGVIALQLRPFELVTLRFTPGSPRTIRIPDGSVAGLRRRMR